MKKIALYITVCIPLMYLASCEKDNTTAAEEIIVIDDKDFDTPDWTDETHSKSADPNFAEVFEDNTVKRIDIVVTKDRWQSMLDDMTDKYGQFGVNRGGPGSPRDQGGQAVVTSDENPIFVPAEVFYQGKEWYRVGIRFKGNSSLQSSWKSGILKLSFKLDFDEFEDTYPQIDNQRFYGFKKLSLKNNYLDKSMVREKVASDVFREAGLPSSHTAFYTLYVDYGEGPIYFGVYTLVEEVDDTVIDTQFSNNDGNLYKPDGMGASFKEGTFTSDVFVKKTNEDKADYTDIQSLFTALHASYRTTDPATWRSNLEAIFDVSEFLNYLAVNTTIQNWDTYGRMTHNYYLYNNPDTGKLSWIPWDHNEALQIGNMQGAVQLDFSDVNGTEWPLIGYLYKDSTYKSRYKEYVQKIIDKVFNVTKMQTIYTNYARLLEPYATTEIAGYSFLNSPGDFQAAIDELKNHVSIRNTAVSTYINE
ncbi:CotH kinase family protein [Flavobacteriaceae bacterium F08102]|nr:CotH kinase family protein [Flavobacteriaceae bacterium F08102]